MKITGEGFLDQLQREDELFDRSFESSDIKNDISKFEVTKYIEGFKSRLAAAQKR